MRPRSVQFAWLLVLFCAFGTADAVARAAGSACRDCASLRVLLLQVAGATQKRPAASQTRVTHPIVSVTPAATTQTGIAWAMRPPAAHTALQHAVTASGI